VTRVLAIGLVGLTMLGVLGGPGVDTRAPLGRASTAVPAALIDIGSLFGSADNEPDENEPDDDATTAARPAPRGPTWQAYAPVALIAAALGALLGGFVAIRLYLLWRRMTTWANRMWRPGA
jgi:hypothetical protein